MTSLKKTAISSLATASLLASVFAPSAFANTHIGIVGNGSHSDNKISFDSNHELRVSQSNEATIHNSVNVDAQTGGNSSSGNTGGNTNTQTGDVDTTVGISTAANINAFSMEGCGCGHENLWLGIVGNGKGSDNEINVQKRHSTEIEQHNEANIETEVTASADTGGTSSNGGNNHNSGNQHDNHDKKHSGKKHHFSGFPFWNHHGGNNGNTGGNNETTTGDVMTDIFIQTHANANFLHL